MSACLGLTWLGMCAYDPASPSPTYFSLGDAIAALAFTMAVQTFLKPIYRLRLATRYFSIARLYALIFAAVGMTIVAALVPNFPIFRGGWWGYPIVYELFATLLFGVAYGAVAFSVVRPIKVTDKRVETFARDVGGMLSEATENDRVDLLPDLRISLPRLIKLASFIDRRDDVSAFWIFAHRKRIQQAQYAASLLGILSDPHFCRSVVIRAPWTVARLIKGVADKKLHTGFAQKFVQELASQAILSDDGIMTREVDYHGFAEAPLLSDALFSEPFIVNRYDPLGSFLYGDQITGSVLKRFNKAAIRCYECIIEEREFHHARTAFSIERIYRSAGLRARMLRDRASVEADFSFEFGRAVENAIVLSIKLMAAADDYTYEAMFITNAEEHRHDPLETLVEIVFHALENIANGFTGPDDTFWHPAINVMLRGYNSVGEEPPGMTPFQQRLTIKLVDKLNDNMRGYYPAICRVLLSTVGPYAHDALQPNMTAFNILRNVMYRELKKFPDLAATKPDKIPHYLPNNSTYDIAAATLTHTYFGGAQRFTDLRSLQVIDIDLLDKEYHRSLTKEEKEAATREIY